MDDKLCYNELHKSVLYLFKNIVSFDYMPIWSHITYVYIRVKYEYKLKITHPRQNMGKLLLIYFVGKIPFKTPIHIFDLVIYCAIKVISTHLKIPHTKIE